MTVKAKFSCINTTKITHGYGVTNTVELMPVYATNEENASFYKATPSGSIKLEGLTDETAANFEPGKEYYIEFTAAN